MNVNDIITAISTVGFPIVMCVWFNIENNKKIDMITEALNNNTQALNILKNQIGVDDDELHTQH